MKVSTLFAGAALAATLAATQVHATPLPIVGGTTAVTLTSAATLTSLGIGVAPLGSATISPGSSGTPIAYFGITGGKLDTDSFAGMILHDGSGLSLSSGPAVIDLSNFVIDTTALLVSGDVAIGTTQLNDVGLLDVSLTGNPFTPFSLKLTAAAAGALETVFGISGLTGAELGVANTLPITAAVPEPATYLSFMAGLGLLGVALRRRRSALLPSGAA
ncbi:MAG: PEP-CTERM sorting domain-containing protein [Rubrivivax sp.]|nr:PEP-CTERM sorting domain-containing protein [Rubrivivax sp.]